MVAGDFSRQRPNLRPGNPMKLHIQNLPITAEETTVEVRPCDNLGGVSHGVHVVDGTLRLVVVTVEFSDSERLKMQLNQSRIVQ